MARKGITYDQVANAAAAIKARGSEPTVSAIRLELGQQGSFTTLCQHLAKWRDEAATQQQQRSLPQEVENAMMTAMMTVWNVSNKLHIEECAAIKQDFDDRREILETELKTAKDEIALLEQENFKFDAECQSQTERAIKAEKELAATQAELKATKQMYEALIKTLKQQGAKESKVVDTTKGHQQEKAASHESRQA